jgi:hypothetical protein
MAAISTKITYKILVGKYETKGPLVRTRLKWKDNINICLKVMTCRDVNFIKLGHDTVQWQIILKMAMNEFYILGYNVA